MKKYLFWGLALFVSMGFVACSDDEDDVPNLKSNYHVLANIDKAYYIQQANAFNSGNLTFENKGTQLDANKAARVIASGGYIYSLNYGTGLISQLKPNKTGGYDRIKEIDAGLAVGTVHPRFKLANSNTIMAYNVVVEPVTDAASGNAIDYTCTLRLVNIEIPSMSITNLTEFVIPQSENAKKDGGFYPIRADGPVISGNKIYFGLMHTTDLDLAPPFRKPKQSGLETLVFDYPSLSNGVVVESDKASGHTSGYRAPSMHVDENGDVYQVNWFMAGNSFDLSGGDKTVISRLKDGKYDDTYQFNVSEKLGLTSNVASVGWFYVGNGIGYMPIQLEDEGSFHKANSWTLAKIDVYKQTAVKLDVPMSNLLKYESAVVDNGKFYMAISPIGGESNIYEFDPSIDGANGFTKGLTLDGGNVGIEGIYMTQD